MNAARARVEARTRLMDAVADDPDNWTRFVLWCMTGNPEYAPSPASDKTAVYFIRRGEDGPIKIGVSVRPNIRLGELQVGSPEDLTLLGVIPGDFDTERSLHRQFRHLHLRGEWYAPHPDLMAFIARRIRAA